MSKCVFLKRMISLVLILSVIAINITGCTNSIDTAKNDIAVSDVNVDELVNSLADNIQEDIDNEKKNREAKKDQLPKEEILDNSVDSLNLSQDWENYVGDIETFVYGLIIEQLRFKYDVFPAYTVLNNGSEVYGLAYTDYSECYVDNEAEPTKTVFMAGIMPFYGEKAIPSEEFNNGLFIHDIDYEDEETSFMLKYLSDPFMEHCVVYGKYLKYGINEAGVITFDVSDYEKGSCDKSLGSLYSYDENEYVYDINIGNNIQVTGKPVSTSIDYETLEKEINRVLEQQDVNFYDMKIESYAYASKEAIIGYLRGLQEETFLGYPVNELVQLAEELDPLQCLQIADSGLKIVNIEGAPSDDKKALIKWLVGTGCVILTAVATVAAVVTIECPPLSAASGAVAGISIEVFMQVVINNEDLSDVKWEKVALAAATGAVAGFLAPYILAVAGGSGAAYYLADSTIDGLLGGIEMSVEAWMEGESGMTVAKQFGYGLALGFGLSAGFKGVGVAFSKAATKLMPKFAKNTGRFVPQLARKISKFSGKLGKTLMHLKSVADSSRFHSEYISKKIAEGQLVRIIGKGDKRLAIKSINSLTKNITDINGNPMSKKELLNILENAKDGTIIARSFVDGEVVNIIKKNGMAGLQFDVNKYQSVVLPKGLVADRTTNFEEAAILLKKSWVKDPSKIPESIKVAIEKSGEGLENMRPGKLVDIIQSSDMVLHENIDMKTITLVSRSIHDKTEGGLAHMGGFGLAKYLKANMGTEFFERFLTATSSAATSASY